MKRFDPRAAALAALGLSVWGCGSTDTSGVAPPAAAYEKDSTTMSAGVNPVPTRIMQQIVDEVSRESGVERSDLEVVRAEQATWNDGALGCPQPNVEYTQMIVQGYWVIVRAGGEEFDYRVDDRGRFVRCTGATRRAPIVYPPDS